MFPHVRHSIPPLLLALAAGLVFASPATATWPTTPVVQVPLCTAAVDQLTGGGCSDGAGGSIVVWVDSRLGYGNQEIYAQRVSAAGVPLWTADGVIVCNAPGDQGKVAAVNPVAVVSDGAGGAYVAWEDRRNPGATGTDIYMQRILANGAALWTPNGIAITTALNNQTQPWLTSDGAGGCYVTWYDASAFGSLYAQRVLPGGSISGPAGGAAIEAGSSGNTVSGAERCVSDLSNGFYVTYFRTGSSSTQLYVAHVNISATVVFNNLVSSQAGVGFVHLDDMLADGQGGVIVLDDWWSGATLTPTNIEMYRAGPAGAVLYDLNPLAPTGQLSSAQGNGSLAADGNGGAIAIWQDSRNSSTTGYDIYAQYVSGSGQTMYPAAGLAICTAAGDQTWTRACGDGSGGALAVWEDRRVAGNTDVWAQRLGASGPRWTAGGVAVCLAPGQQYQPYAISDGAGSAIVAWWDQRTGVFDTWCQRLDHNGNIGDPAPAIVAVRDVPNDQGGQVKVSWNASTLDADPDYWITSYTLWRSVPPNAAQRMLALGASLASDGDEPAAAHGPLLQASIENGQVVYWEYLGSQPAVGDAGYSEVATTTSDSTTTSNPKTLFRVQARTASTSLFWNSPADSGYSVDNLAPAVPAPFQATWSNGTMFLHWGANTEADLSGYRLHRGGSAAFTPDASNLLAAQPDTGYADPSGTASWFYKLAAVDLHGNESPFALLSPGSVAQVTPSAAPAFALAPLSPDPGPGERALRFSLPEPAEVELLVTDPAGRRIATLARGRFEAGPHELRWSGTAEGGRRLPSGIYFALLRAGGQQRVRRFAIVR
jgi:hypothetical protein